MVDNSDLSARPPDAATEKCRARLAADTRPAIQGLLLLDATIRLVIWSGAIVLTTLVFSVCGLWPGRLSSHADIRIALLWGLCAYGWVVLYNVIYAAELAVLRLFLPTPAEGEYRMVPGGPVNRQLIWASLIGVLVKARYEAPFPAFLVHHVTSLPPMRWLVNRAFRLKSQSCNITDPLIMDPHLVTIGRNVVIGLGAVITGHVQDRERIVFKRTIVEDNVIIGGQSGVLCGAHIKSGAVIGAHAVVLPDTVVGPDEFWAGVPARKIRDLPPPGAEKAL